jgi:hypothetical protein
MSQLDTQNDAELLDDDDDDEESPDHLSSSLRSTRDTEGDTDTEEGDFTDSEEKPPLDRAMVLIAIISLAGAGLLYLMCSQSSAPAAPPSADVAAANDTVTQFLSDGGRQWAAIQRTFSDTESLVHQVQKYPSASQVSLSQLTTNPFLYAQAQHVADVDEVAEKQRKEQLRVAALQAVQVLHLQSVVSNATRSACMIDGAFYTQGQTVEGFLIERIDTNSVILRQGDSRFQIRMQN